MKTSSAAFGIVALVAALTVAELRAEGPQRIAHDIDAGRHTLRFLEDPDMGFIDTLQIFQEGDLVYEGYFEAFVYMVEEPPGSEFSVLPMGLDVDVTGDGRPNFVLQSFSGGAHCCFYIAIFEREPAIYFLAEFDGGHAPVELINLDDDPEYEVRLYDWTFAYWKASFAESPAPQVILDWQEGFYVGSADLMRKPPPSARELAAAASEARRDSIRRQGPSPLIWATMLDYIYGGHSDAAFKLLDLAWPRDMPGRDAFLLQFGAQLSYSHYWEAVAELNGWER